MAQQATRHAHSENRQRDAGGDMTIVRRNLYIKLRKKLSFLIHQFLNLVGTVRNNIPRLFGALVLAAAGQATAEVALPKDILNQIPKGHAVLSSASGDLNRDGLNDWLVVLHMKNEKAIALKSNTPARPLWLFLQTPKGRYTLTKRNDDVVEGVGGDWRCDSFGDGTGGVVIKNGYFTVEHEIACGAHSTDFITFRYAPDLKDWIFHKRVFENWVMNNSSDAKADALILDSRVVETGKGKPPVLFERYQPN